MRPVPANPRTEVPSPEPATRPGDSAVPVPLGTLIIFALTILAYWPALQGGFILDDNTLLTDNPLIKAADGLYRFWFTTEPIDYWPVSNTSLWIEWRLWGMNSTGYHATNLLLHLTEVLLLWRILFRLNVAGCFFAALLFALHPVNVETVAWIAQRKSLLAMLFSQVSVLCFLEVVWTSKRDLPAGDSWKSWWLWLSVLMYVLAVLSKVSALVLPGVLVGLILWRRPLTRVDGLRLLPFFVVASVLLQVNLWFRAHGVTLAMPLATPLERVLGAGAVVWFYLGKALVPFPLSFMYPDWHVRAERIEWWIPTIAAALVGAALFWFRRRGTRPWLFAAGYFVLNLLPVLGLTDVGLTQHIVVADHYQHAALPAVVVLAATAWVGWRQRIPGSRRWMTDSVAAAVVGIFFLLTWQQARIYIDAKTLYSATLRRNPDAWMAHNNLGFLLLQADQRKDAIEHFRQAVRQKPDYYDAQNNLGFALILEGRLDEGRIHVEEALRLKPDSPEIHLHLANSLVAAGRTAEAIDHFEAALRLDPQMVDAELNLGRALYQLDRLADAILHFRRVRQLAPQNPDGCNALGVALAETGAFDEALAQLHEALRLSPGNRDLLDNIAAVEARKRQAAGQE